MNSTAGTFTTDGWVIKLAPDGTLLWDRLLFEGEGAYYGIALVADMGNDVVAVVTHQPSVSVPHVGSLYRFDTRAILLDAEGEVRWELGPETLSEEGPVQLNSAMPLAPSNVVLLGSTELDGLSNPWMSIVDREGVSHCELAIPINPGDSRGQLRDHGTGARRYGRAQ